MGGKEQTCVVTRDAARIRSEPVAFRLRDVEFLSGRERPYSAGDAFSRDFSLYIRTYTQDILYIMLFTHASSIHARRQSYSSAVAQIIEDPKR